MQRTIGELAALLATGQIVAVPIMVVGVMDDPHPLVPDLTIAPLSILLGILLGFPIPLIPNVAGSTLFARLGHCQPGCRHPLVWTASGSVIGAAMMGAVTADLDGAHFLVGALCASICRLFAL